MSNEHGYKGNLNDGFTDGIRREPAPTAVSDSLMRPHINMNKRRGLETWVKVVMVLLVLAVAGAIAYPYISSFRSLNVTLNVPSEQNGKSSNPADYPHPIWADDSERNKGYELAFPQDPVWSQVFEEAIPLKWSASVTLSRSKEDAVIIGGHSTEKPFAMTCDLPAKAIVQQFAARKVDGIPYMLVEYVGQQLPDGPSSISGDAGDCAVGTLLMADDDMAYYWS